MIEHFYICDVHVLSFRFYFFSHGVFLGFGVPILNWFDASTEFYWIGGWSDFC